MVGTLAWSPDGRFIALGDVDDETLSKGGIQVIDAVSRAVVASLETGNVHPMRWCSRAMAIPSSPSSAAICGRGRFRPGLAAGGRVEG